MFDQFPFSDVFEAVVGQLSFLGMSLVLAVVVFLIVIGARRRREAARRRGSIDASLFAAMPLKAIPVLNHAESRIYDAIAAVLDEAGVGHRLLAQVSVGEVLKVQPNGANRSERQTAFNMINAKRFDFLIVDRNWQPVAALEYHGTGHDQGDARKRDAIKRAACKSAGLPLIEVMDKGLDPNQRCDLRRLLGIPTQLAAE